MIWRSLEGASLPYPFNNPSVEYFCLGRNAIYAAAQCLGLADREVLFPSYFEGIELDALLQAGVRYRFYRVREHMRIDLGDVASEIRPDTRAIYLIHYQGFPGPVEELAEICRKREILLIEDCALALLSRVADKPLGSFGDAAIFSIRKTLPAEYAGALILRGGQLSGAAKRRSPSLFTTLGAISSSVMRNLEIRGKTRSKSVLACLRSIGKTTTRALVGEQGLIGGDDFMLSQVSVGMSRLMHFVIAGQDFSMIIARRRRNFLHLLSRLGKLVQPIHDTLPAGVCPISYTFEHEKKYLILKKLLARGLDANNWEAVHPVVPMGEFLEAQRMRSTILQLPCHQDLTPEAVDWVADQVCDVMSDLN